MVSKTIEIPSNTLIFGEGEGTVIKMEDNVGRDTTLMRTGKRGSKREHIVIKDMTLDFNRVRWNVSGGETLKDTDGGDQDNDQTTLSICFSEYVLVKNVRCLDGYKHCIDITSPRYPSNTKSEPFNTILFVVILPLVVTSCKITEPAPPNSLTVPFVILV